MELTNKELLNIVGGKKINWGLGIILGALGTFFAGLIDGYLRPLKCNA